MGVRLNLGLTMGDVLSIIENSLLKNNKSNLICTTNAEFVLDAQKNVVFKDIINNSALSIPDGLGILLADRYLTMVADLKPPLLVLKKFLSGLGLGLSVIFNAQKVVGRIPGVDLAYNICKLSHEKNYSIFFLGGRLKNISGKYIESNVDVAKSAVSEVHKLYPNANVIGGTSEFSHKESDDTATVNHIKECMRKNKISELDFLFVAYNHFNQERWIVRNATKIPAKVCIGVGGTFDYLAGYLPRKESHRFEWFFRLLQQPWRFRRIFNAVIKFPSAVFLYSLKHKN